MRAQLKLSIYEIMESSVPSDWRARYLDRFDFRRLLSDHPEKRAPMVRVMEDRLAQLEAESPGA